MQKSCCDLPLPDPSLDEETTDWCTLHSLASLGLSLETILRDCTLPNEPPLLIEFPLKTEVSPPTTKFGSPLLTLLPRPRLNMDRLSSKRSQLDLTVDLYRDYISDLHQGSKKVFGVVRGQRVCVLVDTSDLHVCWTKRSKDEHSEDEDKDGEDDDSGRDEERQEFVDCRSNLRQLFEEQLSQKSKICLLTTGPKELENTPTSLNFHEHKQRCMMMAGEWLDSLGGSGACSLLEGLDKALSLSDIDTVLVVMGSRPKEDKGSLVSYVRERLTTSTDLHLHWVAHLCNEETRDMLFQLASETGAQFHSYSKSKCIENAPQVEDTDINTITEQLKQAEMIIGELENLKSGHLSDSVQNILTQLNIVKASIGPNLATVDPVEHIPVSSDKWLKTQSVDVLGLSIYRVLAPNAYRKLKVELTHSPDTQTVIPSVVFDNVMPQFTWHDGSQKYLHVDVHLLENYQVKMEAYITKLQQRLNWLASGSQAPFGVLYEKSVVLVVECSVATLPFISRLQNNLRLLFNEQLSRTSEFNIIRIGGEGESGSWQHGFIPPTSQTLTEAWVWLLTQALSSSSVHLMPALEMVLADDTYTRERDVGIYLILNSLPKEKLESICSFIYEKTAESNIHIHIICYHHTPPTVNHTVAALSFEEGCYANDQELTHSLQQVARAGKGRFHSFKGPSSVSGDDIDRVLEELQKAQDHLQMAGKILEDYRTFCQRCVPVLPTPPSPPPPSDPPPLYPHPTTAFLSRMTATSRRLARSVSDSHLSHRETRQRNAHCHTRRTKTYTFYLDNDHKKSLTHERIPQRRGTVSPKKSKITDCLTISEYGLKSLGLDFSRFETQITSQNKRQKMTYKHINKRGEIVDLYTDRPGLRRFVQRLKQARESYLAKLAELNTGWHQFFGCVTESKVMFVIDASSSMAGFFDKLQSALIDFLHNPPRTLKHFNMLTYSSSVNLWRKEYVSVTKENTNAAVQWLERVRADGCSCLLHALKVSLESGVDNIYLITDGTADHTHEFLLSQLPQLRVSSGDTWKIHTVAFHCTLESSYKFLREFAHKTGGRYHCYPSTGDSVLASDLLQNRFLGDDVRKIAQEIVSADENIRKALCFL